MSRWAPNAHERLQAAAWELFAENGYEATTVAQIAERAGLNRATFFRHFADKREILFGGEDALSTAFVEAIRAAPVGTAVSECLEAALTAAGELMTSEQHRRAGQRRRAAEASVEVQERGLAKNARIAAAAAAALRDRGAGESTAQLGAATLMLAFAAALREWLDDDDPEPFAPYATRAFVALRASALELAAPSRSSMGPRQTSNAPRAPTAT